MMGNIVKCNINKFVGDKDQDECFDQVNQMVQEIINKMFLANMGQEMDVAFVLKHMKIVLENIGKSDIQKPLNAKDYEWIVPMISDLNKADLTIKIRQFKFALLLIDLIHEKQVG